MGFLDSSGIIVPLKDFISLELKEEPVPKAQEANNNEANAKDISLLKLKFSLNLSTFLWF
tara:strand:+ start:700 stop:879 length:180 start_codon:yes stop_codon:yes gene_type:complete